jgi:hypothetical protein
LTCQNIPKITDKPLGAPQIFGTLIQAKHLQSFPGPNPRIQVKIEIIFNPPLGENE